MLQPGDKAPDFSAADQNGITRSLKDYKGKKLVLYFYPKDMTSGCTRQACDFRDNMARIAGAGVELLGVSPDPVASHAKFVQKESLNFPLLSDESKSIVEAYGGRVERARRPVRQVHGQIGRVVELGGGGGGFVDALGDHAGGAGAQRGQDAGPGHHRFAGAADDRIGQVQRPDPDTQAAGLRRGGHAI